MKRLIFASILVLSLAVLGFSGNRIAGSILSAYLPPLLTEQLGLQVQLTPLNVQLLQLSASSADLVMGDLRDPAVLAKNIKVSLVLTDLLHGEIRLRSGSATDVMIRPSRWPSSRTAGPDNYEFLDPWLPRSLQFESGRYVSDSGANYLVAQAQWQRQANGSASVNWIETRRAGDIAQKMVLKSLSDLLQLAPIALELNVEVANKPDSAIKIDATIKPDKVAAYVLHANVQSEKLNAQVNATGTSAWSLPDQSVTTIALLEPSQLLLLVNSYSAKTAKDTTIPFLDSALPRLDLPGHQGHISIDEIRVEDEVAKSTAFNFRSGEKGIQIDNLTSKGPSGILSGELGISSSEQGWSLSMNASLKAQEPQGSLAKAFIGADWLWDTGEIALAGNGTTWLSLLNSLTGHAALAGNYLGETKTPVSITTQLATRPDELALEQLSLILGDGRLDGSAILSRRDRHKLTMDLNGDKVHLGFLFEGEEAQPETGVALPEYLGFMPELDMALTVSINGLDAPGISLARAQATLERTEEGGKFVASAIGKHYGTIKLALDARTPADLPHDVTLKLQFAKLDLSNMFKQPEFLYSRSSGSMSFHSQGQGMLEIFGALKGATRLAVDIRADNDWQREARAEEQLLLSGDSHLVLSQNRVVGVTIEKLNIGSIEQDLTGDLSLVSGRDPWLVADLESTKLDVNTALAMLPQTSQKADDPGLLMFLRGVGAAQVSLEVKSLSVADIDLSDTRLEIVSGEALIDLKQFDFTADNGTLKSHGKIFWKGDKALFEATANLANINLDQYLIRKQDFPHVPVSGSVTLSSAGSKFAELLGNLTGHVDLQANDPRQNDLPQARRKLVMNATLLPNGARAEIVALEWAGSQLSGNLSYYRTTPPSLEVELRSGSLSLLPWENAEIAKASDTAQIPASTTVNSVASSVGDALLTPFRLLSKKDDESRGEKLFSAAPLALASLKTFNMKIAGQLDTLLSNAIEARNLGFTGDITNGQLTLHASSGDLGQGTGEVTVELDANAQPATVKLVSTFQNIHSLTDKKSYPRSGFIALQSVGQSLAEIAANTSGLAYLKLGKGPFDYANSSLLTRNLANSVYQTLIPDIERNVSELECGVTVAVFDKGLGITPYGFAARTGEANLLGRLEVDLGKETMKMSLDSRGRQGVGLSVGSIFSNSIRIKGPLTAPQIVPDAISLAWRGWAAFMTAGLSVIGESVIKRVLASGNPCESIETIIEKELCPHNAVAASTAMMCPKGSDK
ncbi:MAG: hypothetical protein ACI9NT_001907 [Bacteroidia bacterium]